MNAVPVILFSDDAALVKVVREIVSSASGCGLEHVRDNGSASGYLKSGKAGLAVLHLAKLAQQADVARLLDEAARLTVPAVVIGDEHDPALVLRMLRFGAVDYLQRPLNITRLALLVDILTMRARHCPAIDPSAEILVGDAESDGFLVISPKMRSVVAQVRKVAHLDSTILLTGETGTGKSCLALVIHKLSARCDQPFLVVNCGALSPTLIESELFGHMRGAFTGADRNHQGKLAEVRQGTLLLDEIDSLPLPIQAKLLRAVEERRFEPVGSNQTLTMGARLIVASNRALEEEVAAGRFRADLYFRLNVLGFHLPALRDRREAIPRLIGKYITEFHGYHRGRVTGVEPLAQAALQAYNWPGNVRELRNVVERAVAVCSGAQIESSDLPQAIQQCAPQASPDSMIADKPPNALAAARGHAERQRITDVLERHNNNRSHAALELGISRVTLYKKLHRLGLT